MTGNSRKWRGLVAVGALSVVGLSACGSSHPAAGPETGAAKRPVTAVLATAYENTVAAKSAQLTLQVTVTAAGKQVTESGTGAVDWGTRQGTIDVKVEVPAASGSTSLTLREVIDGGNAYVMLPSSLIGAAGGKPWIETSFGSLTSGSSTGEDPTQVLSLLEADSSGVTEVGPATIDGAATTEYRAVVDPAKVEAGAPAAVKQLLARASQASGLTSVPIDVWVDGQGLARQITEDVTTTPPASSGGSSAGPVKLDLTMNLSNYGQPVSVTVPPASQVTSIPLSQLFGGSGAGS
jgi:hypothetical protein